LAPLAGFIRGIDQVAHGGGIGGFVEGFGQGALNSVKIDLGYFAWDSNRNLGGNYLSIMSRFTWENRQMTYGNLYNHGLNLTGQVDWVRYKYGATVVSSSIQRGGITLGNYITGRAGVIEADENNRLFQHEYGHVLQSRASGFAYFSRFGIPSFADLAFNGEPYGDHDLHPAEQDANARAFEYFSNRVDGFYAATTNAASYSGSGWDFNNNPVAGNRNFLDFRNTTDFRMIRNSRIRSSWYDYANPLFGSIFNSFILYNP